MSFVKIWSPFYSMYHEEDIVGICILSKEYFMNFFLKR